MHAIIRRIRDSREEVWTGEEWITTSVYGWRDAASFGDHEAAAFEMEQHEDDEDFATATVVDVE